mmetsp:Transcript_15830/g.34330  ORF Transcript_15830/g.34330 Transcript_15830/m.34330 type:complete len:230 (+) Transcript_15830:412-1101(+)|eukprot:CAMPEP_0118947928 /NCGR_PEP_ID=MMETSP1169-20130426/46905_1 /TAXON_ID=36882 /ORGANISM="Pyramimonas obovata, Strain CCMP722" /LENGTH=229 /DNA_ID=CAMNT_0006894237 /DNA_START=326 /DNA_END=1015 /DNA_ORIENTATION=+
MPAYNELEYWETRYGASGTGLFDWYVGYDGVKPFLEMVPLRAASNVLVIGCGNSPLSEQIYDDGFRKITSVDFCETVISYMKSRAAVDRPELKYLTMDAVQLPLPDESFDVILDKGMLDCVLCEKESWGRVRQLVERVSNVLAPGGVYIVYSYGNPDDRRHLFNEELFGWKITTYWIPKPSIMDLRAGKPNENTPKEILRWELEGIDEDKVHFIYVMRKNSEDNNEEQQ